MKNRPANDTYQNNVTYRQKEISCLDISFDVKQEV